MQGASRRQTCLKIDLFSGDGVLEIQKLGVQEISSIAREAGEIFKRLTGYAIQRIAYQGMSDGCQMDSDLMRASRILGLPQMLWCLVSCLVWCLTACCLAPVRSPSAMTLTVCHLGWRPTRIRCAGVVRGRWVGGFRRGRRISLKQNRGVEGKIAMLERNASLPRNKIVLAK
jgi:hypothetical protein